MAQSESISKLEQEKPLPPNTVCVALYDFTGNAPNDLPFNEGEQLVIVEPSREMFWYIARNCQGKTGSVPVTFLKQIKTDAPPPLPSKPPSSSPPPLPIKPPFLSNSNPSQRPPIPQYLEIQEDPIPPAIPPRNPNMMMKHNSLPRSINMTVQNPPSQTRAILPKLIDSRPPMPLPSQPEPAPITACIKVGKYPTIQAFREKSGWFRPAPDIVLSGKVFMSPQVFRTMMCGVFYFQHKFEPTKHYVGSSLKLFHHLVSLFERLYEKKEDNLNNLERELRFNTPDASDWNVCVWICHADDLSLEVSKHIIEHETLPPKGLNESLEFVSRKHFHAFCEWYTEYRVKNKTAAAAASGITTFSSH